MNREIGGLRDIVGSLIDTVTINQHRQARKPIPPHGPGGGNYFPRNATDVCRISPDESDGS